MAEENSHQQFIHGYEESKDGLFSYLMNRLNFDRPACEDLLMEITLKAYEKFWQFDSQKGSFKAWFFGIGRNHLINHWRNAKETQSLEGAEEKGLKMPSAEIRSDLEDWERQRQIQNVLGLMSKAEQEIVMLHYLSELSHKEISSATGKSEGAIRTSLSRALKKFKSIYGKLYG